MKTIILLFFISLASSCALVTHSINISKPYLYHQTNEEVTYKQSCFYQKGEITADLLPHIHFVNIYFDDKENYKEANYNTIFIILTKSPYRSMIYGDVEYKVTNVTKRNRTKDTIEEKEDLYMSGGLIITNLQMEKCKINNKKVISVVFYPKPYAYNLVQLLNKEYHYKEFLENLLKKNLDHLDKYYVKLALRIFKELKENPNSYISQLYGHKYPDTFFKFWYTPKRLPWKK